MATSNKGGSSNSKPEKRPFVRKKPVTINVPVVRVPKPLQGFVDFIREQGVIGLAIGLVIGIAIKSVVDSLVQNIFNPLVGIVTGGVDLGSKSVCLKFVTENGVEVCKNSLNYGKFISDVLSFVIVAAAVYFMFIVLKLDKLDKPKK